MRSPIEAGRRDELLAAGAPYAHRPIRAAWLLLQATGLLATEPHLAAIVDEYLEIGRPDAARDAHPDREPPLVAWIGYPAWQAIGQALADDAAGRRALFQTPPEFEDRAFIELAAALAGNHRIDLLEVIAAAALGSAHRAALVTEAILITTGTSGVQGARPVG